MKLNLGLERLEYVLSVFVRLIQALNGCVYERFIHVGSNFKQQALQIEAKLFLPRSWIRWWLVERQFRVEDILLPRRVDAVFIVIINRLRRWHDGRVGNTGVMASIVPWSTALLAHLKASVRGCSASFSRSLSAQHMTVTWHAISVTAYAAYEAGQKSNDHNTLQITSSNTSRFSKLFHCSILQEICNKMVIKYPTSH